MKKKYVQQNESFIMTYTSYVTQMYNKTYGQPYYIRVHVTSR